MRGVQIANSAKAGTYEAAGLSSSGTPSNQCDLASEPAYAGSSASGTGTRCNNPAMAERGFMATVTTLALALVLTCAGPATAAQPADFQVGAASASLAPQVPVYSGGFGASPPIQKVNDPIETRAMFVSNGQHAVAMATLEAQGYFAAYQEGPYGITDIRERAAAEISKLGGARVSAGDIIVQATHSHAAPTLEGIWGPVPSAYLRLVHDRTVEALVSAARQARPAWLQWGTVDAPYLDNINTAQTDSYAGWSQDGQVSVLRAVSPKTGATIATFANVPAHADIVNGAKLKLFSADYFGFARATLERRLGGLAIVGPATLGREESPVQTTGLANSSWYSCVVSDLITRALDDAHWVTDPTVRSTESFLQIPGTNAALLGLVAAWHLPDEQKQQVLDAGGIYPIDRQDTPPYLTGSVLGTPLTALRIGRLVYASMPGEPFPEVRYAIANAVQGADAVVALSKGQDDLGYYYPAFVYPAAFVYNSDHHIYNVAPQAGDQIIQGQVANIGTLGFASHFDLARPLPTRFEQALQPGLQALASPGAGAVERDGTLPVTLQAIYSSAAFGGSPLAGKVHWDFGDGSQADSADMTRFVHAFRPGRYTVKLTARSESGDAARWELVVRAYPRLRPKIRARRSGRRVRLTASASGGSGNVLAWRWEFRGGGAAAGQKVRHVFRRGVRPRATLTVADSAGCGTASATYRARAAARRPHRRRAPHRRRRPRRQPHFTG